jgi:hypothetical protein
VSDLYIPLIGLPVLLQENRWAQTWEYIDRSQTLECGKIGTEAAQFLFRECINSNFFAVCSLPSLSWSLLFAFPLLWLDREPIEDEKRCVYIIMENVLGPPATHTSFVYKARGRQQAQHFKPYIYAYRQYIRRPIHRMCTPIYLEFSSLTMTTLQGKSHLCISFLGIAWPRSQFPHSCVCERFIYF